MMFLVMMNEDENDDDYTVTCSAVQYSKLGRFQCMYALHWKG